MDNLIRVIAGDGSVMCCAVDSTAIAAEAERIHQTSATVTAALGRLLTAGAMMGAMLKNREDSVTLRLAGGGPAGQLIVVADGDGMVKGDVTNPVVEIPLNDRGKLDVAGAVGRNGSLTVIRDLGFNEPTIGSVPLVSGEIAEDVTYYYAVSEQIPTVCGLGVLVNPDLTVRSAGGYIVQLLPGADDSVIDRLEANIQKLPPVSTMFAHGMTPEQVAFAALDGFEPEVLDSRVTEYRCDCSRERMRSALVSLGREELERMAEEGEDIEVNCHFCGTTHRFSPQEIRGFIRQSGSEE
ncbi:MAG: Hsp33 family molecular chaperone HslO [Clostridiales bacterium]|nr:Hsp33 family molecular chaperone HslO [Clostridiales bacterium]